jgi:hypothetical protein
MATSQESNTGNETPSTVESIAQSFGVDPRVLIAAADMYAARQTRAAHPNGYFNGPRFYLAESEMQYVPESVPPPSNRFPYTLMNFARTKPFVSAFMGIPVEALAAEVQRRNALRKRGSRKGNGH